MNDMTLNYSIFYKNNNDNKNRHLRIIWKTGSKYSSGNVQKWPLVTNNKPTLLDICHERLPYLYTPNCQSSVPPRWPTAYINLLSYDIRQQPPYSPAVNYRDMEDIIFFMTDFPFQFIWWLSTAPWTNRPVTSISYNGCVIIYKAPTYNYSARYDHIIQFTQWVPQKICSWRNNFPIYAFGSVHTNIQSW